MEGANSGAKPDPDYFGMAEALQQHIVRTTRHVSYELSAADAMALHRAYDDGYICKLFSCDGRFGHICYDRVEKYSGGRMVFDMERRVDGSEKPGSRPAAIREFFKSGLHERFLGGSPK